MIKTLPTALYGSPTEVKRQLRKAIADVWNCRSWDALDAFEQTELDFRFDGFLACSALSWKSIRMLNGVNAWHLYLPHQILGELVARSSYSHESVNTYNSLLIEACDRFWFVCSLAGIGRDLPDATFNIDDSDHITNVCRPVLEKCIKWLPDMCVTNFIYWESSLSWCGFLMQLIYLCLGEKCVFNAEEEYSRYGSDAVRMLVDKGLICRTVDGSCTLTF